jgi:hypothetical protein
VEVGDERETLVGGLMDVGEDPRAVVVGGLGTVAGTVDAGVVVALEPGGAAVVVAGPPDDAPEPAGGEPGNDPVPAP